MIKRVIVGLSFQQDDVDLLNAKATEVGMTKSELVRRLLYKLDADPKMKDIIKRGYFSTSNNVHYANEAKKADGSEEKNNAGDQPGEDSSSLEPTNNLLPKEQIEKRLKEIQEKANRNETITMAEQKEYIQLRKQLEIYKKIEIAKIRWIDED